MYSLKRLHISDLSSSVSNKPKCFNCGILCHFTHATPKGQMCGTCHQYFQRTGNVRPTAAPMRRGGGGKTLTQQLLQPVSFNSPVCVIILSFSAGSGGSGNSAARSAMLKAAGNYSNKPPRGMYVNHDDLVSLATGNVTTAPLGYFRPPSMTFRFVEFLLSHLFDKKSSVCQSTV